MVVGEFNPFSVARAVCYCKTCLCLNEVSNIGQSVRRFIRTENGYVQKLCSGLE